jgi:hypothetical protein
LKFTHQYSRGVPKKTALTKRTVLRNIFSIGL